MKANSTNTQLSVHEKERFLLVRDVCGVQYYPGNIV